MIRKTCGVLIVLLGAARVPAAEPEAIALKAARIFDGSSGGLASNAVVIVRGSRTRGLGAIFRSQPERA